VDLISPERLSPIPLSTAEKTVSALENRPLDTEESRDINALYAFGRTCRQPNSARQKRGWQRTGSGTQPHTQALLNSAYMAAYLIEKITFALYI
jgi:hypothetical protein